MRRKLLTPMLDRRIKDAYPAYNNFIERLYGERAGRYNAKTAIVREVTFQVTNQCNLRCDYCYEHNKHGDAMTLYTSKKIVDMIIQMWKDNDPDALINKKTFTLILDFIGGEPMLEAKLIEDTIEYFFIRCAEEDCSLAQYVRCTICTNGQNFFSDDVQHLLKRYGDIISLNVSIDGVKELHDAHRLDIAGRGSFDKAYAAFKASAPYGHRSTKMTFVPSSIKYLADSVKFMLNNGVDFIACNCAYEPVYSIEDGKNLYEQLKVVSDYMIETEDPRLITMLDWKLGEPFDREADGDGNNYCGGTGAMLTFAPDGKAYPCLRYCPISIGEEKSKNLLIGDFNGIYKSEHAIKVRDYLDSITLVSQSKQECVDCPVQSGCGWCSAWNYESTGDVNKRVTNICNVHKARVLASCRYHNKRFLALHDCLPMRINLPKDDALKYISESEYESLKAQETAAFEELEFYKDLITY